MAEENFVTAQDERKIVFNAASGITHEVLVDTHVSVPLDACITLCGWRWAVAGARATPRVPGVSSLLTYCRTCRKRADGDESEASSAPNDDEVLDELAQATAQEITFDSPPSSPDNSSDATVEGH